MLPDAVRTFLIEEMEQAKERHRDAKERYWEAAGKPRHLPRPRSGLPDSDECIIRRALAEESAARKAHLRALIRLNRYLIEGIVPDDIETTQRPEKAMSVRSGA